MMSGDESRANHEHAFGMVRLSFRRLRRLQRDESRTSEGGARGDRDSLG